MHVKYEVSISYGSKVIHNVKVFAIESQIEPQADSQRQTGQNLDAPNSFRGHKKMLHDLQTNPSIYYDIVRRSAHYLKSFTELEVFQQLCYSSIPKAPSYEKCTEENGMVHWRNIQLLIMDVGYRKF